MTHDVSAGRGVFRPSRRAKITAIIVAAVLAACAVVGGVWWYNAASSDVVRDLAGRAVELDADIRPSPSDVAKMKIEPTGNRLRVSSVGLDVPVTAMNSVDGAVTPPGFTEAFWVRDRGVAPERAASGTVYLAMHSLRNGGKGPGNLLIDVPHGKAAVAVGARVTVGSNAYTVTAAESVGKEALAARSDLWSAKPGRLIMITCLQREGGDPSTDNVVITATLSK